MKVALLADNVNDCLYQEAAGFGEGEGEGEAAEKNRRVCRCLLTNVVAAEEERTITRRHSGGLNGRCLRHLLSSSSSKMMKMKMFT